MSTRGDETRDTPRTSDGTAQTDASRRAGVTRRPGPDRPAESSGTATQRPAAGRNVVGWVALLVGALLTAWQVVVALTIDGVAEASQEVYAAVALFVTLILAVGAVVLGLVALSQRRAPRWPALVGLAVGAQAFLVTVASWIGGLMNTGV